MTVEKAGGVDAPTSAADRRLGTRLNRALCGRNRPHGARISPLAGSEREGIAASAAPGSQASSCGAAGRPLRRGGPLVHVRPRARGRERDPGARPGSAALRRGHGRSTRRTAAASWPCCAATRAASSSPPRTSRRSCGRRSSRSRISASSSTTASTSAASRARSGRTSGNRGSSRAARRSRSSSSRTPTSGTSRRSRERSARRRSHGSSSSAGRRTGSSPRT